MSSAKGLTTILVTLAGIISLATLLWPTPKDLIGETSVQFHVDVGLSFFFGLLYVVGGFLFTLGLSGFTNKLRSVYLTICGGTILMGLTFLQLPIVSLLDAWNQPWVANGIIGIPFVVAAGVIFWGVRLYVQLIEAKTIWANWLVALLVASIGACLSIFLPHAPTPLSEHVFDLGMALRVAPVLLLFMASMTVLRIRKSSGSSYAGPLAWLFTAVLATDLALLTAIIEIATGRSAVSVWFLSLDVAYTFTAVLWLVAAVTFTRIGANLNDTITRKASVRPGVRPRA